MKPIPSQQRALLKRNALLKAAIDEFSEEGFEMATAKSIAAKAGVATGTFYQYFENKNDILCVIAQNRLHHLREQIQFHSASAGAQNDSLSSDVQKIFAQVLQFVYRFHAAAPQLHQVLEQRRSIDQPLRDIMAAGEQVLKDHVLNYVRQFEVDDHQVVAHNLFAMGEGLIHSLVFSNHQIDVEQAINRGSQMLAAFFTEQLQQAA